jgi:hypothetical protein
MYLRVYIIGTRINFFDAAMSGQAECRAETGKGDKMRPNEMEHPGLCRFFKKGVWELYIFYNDRGTKSEGAFGVLLEKGSLFPPNVGNEIDTDLGKMKFYGLKKEHLWDPVGWLFADKTAIPRSNSK